LSGALRMWGKPASCGEKRNRTSKKVGEETGKGEERKKAWAPGPERRLSLLLISAKWGGRDRGSQEEGETGTTIWVVPTLDPKRCMPSKLSLWEGCKKRNGKREEVMENRCPSSSGGPGGST